MISIAVTALVLLAALMHAGWNFIVKSGEDRLLDTMWVAVGGSLLAGCILPFVPIPAEASWPWLAATVLIHVLYYSLLVATYDRADLSFAYPLMRGTAPLLVAAASPVVGEALSPGMCLGIILVGGGILVPAWTGFRTGHVQLSAAGFALANSGVIALYTVSDGVGVRASGNALSYTLWLFFLCPWSISGIALMRRDRSAFVHLNRYWHRIAIGAIMTVASYGIVLWAMTAAPIAVVAALRETSVVFATALGIVMLGERLGRWRVIGAVSIALGVTFIHLG